MIKYNNNTINDWFYETDNIIKVYRNNAICYYKIDSGSPSGQTPCYAVVDDITQYQDTEFEDVFNKADEKWYKLNNLSQYEEYGLYGNGRNITYYDGKLTVDDGYEYIYSGGSWVNVGEVSGGTASLPDVSFMLNYNAKNYNASTYSIAKTSGQTRDVDAVCNYGYHIVDHSTDGYITVTGNTRMLLSGTTYMGRNNTETGCTMTIVSKVRTTSGYSILTNRGGTSSSQMNWMWRYPTNAIFLHGSSSYNNPQYFTNTSTSPIVASVRTYYDSGVKQTLNDWTNNDSYNGSFGYGTQYNGNSSLFCDYASNNSEFWQGDFYWVYMSQNVLTDEQIQQVIDYNESSGGTVEYPIYYDEMQDPPDNLSFSSMVEAEEYECPWVGMKATIDGDNYVFSGDSQSGYEWVEQTLPYDAEIEYLESTGTQYINTNIYLNTSSFEIGYNILGNSVKWGYTHQGSGAGTWITVEASTAFFGNYNNGRVSITTDNTENVVTFASTSGITVNGVSYSKTFQLGSDSIASIPLYVFGRYDFRNGMDYDSSGKVKSFYLKNNGTLVVDMIPVRVGQVGYMYDRVSGQLFGNAGTGSFILGPDK